MNKIDLQIQTTASDGKHTPSEVAQMARELGLEVIAITDHDSVGGVREGMEFGTVAGVRVIPGIEISVEEHDLHILGFGIDYANTELLAELEKSQQGRIDGAKKMVENLKNAGFMVEWEDVQRQAKGVIARPHIARAILARPENKEKLGPVANVHDFIDTFLSNESTNFAHRTHIAAKAAMDIIHNAGGVAVWSHPAIHFPNAYEELEEFLNTLISWGLNGLEVFNPSHTEDDAEFLESLASKYKLLRTAGSDFHEKSAHPPNERGLHSADFLGDYQTYGFPIEDIIPKLDEALKTKNG